VELPIHPDVQKALSNWNPHESPRPIAGGEGTPSLLKPDEDRELNVKKKRTRSPGCFHFDRIVLLHRSTISTVGPRKGRDGPARPIQMLLPIFFSRCIRPSSWRAMFSGCLVSPGRIAPDLFADRPVGRRRMPMLVAQEWARAAE